MTVKLTIFIVYLLSEYITNHEKQETPIKYRVHAI